MFDFLFEHWVDLLLIVVGLSALVVYWFQKHDAFYSAGTLIIGQIMLIEKNITALKETHLLNNVVIYHSKPIIRENMWEKYKHLFVKKLNQSEYEMVQQFFDHTEQLERARLDIVSTITNGWRDKSSVEHNVVAHMIREEANPQEIEGFRGNFRPKDLVFTPDVTINALMKGLETFSKLTGTTAYSKIHKRSYDK